MGSEPKEPVNFRLERRHRDALRWMATERKQAVGELLREAVEEYLANEGQAAWEAEARRTANELGSLADRLDSDESESLEWLDANLEDFAEEWVWNGDQT